MKKLIFIALFLGGCSTNEELPKADVFEIRNIGVLSTSEYTFGKVLRIEDPGEWYAYGDRKILISTKAIVKAGVNLNDLKQEDIKVNGKTLSIDLPPASITSFQMDPNQIKVEMEDINWFRDGFTQQEKNKFLKEGEKKIRQEIEQTNILKDAERTSTEFITKFYKQLGYDSVRVTFKDFQHEP